MKGMIVTSVENETTASWGFEAEVWSLEGKETKLSTRY